MKLRDFLRGHEFAKGTYEVRAARKNESERCLLSLDFREADEDTSRHLPALGVPERLGVQDLRLVLAAAVRAGGSHRGLRDEDLVKLHRAVAVDRHIELFTDLNAITTGLLQHLTWSLGSGIGRVVMSSSKEPLPTAATPDKKRVPEGRGPGKTPPVRATAEEPRKIKLSLTKIAEVLPTRVEQSIPLSSFTSQNEDALRQLRLVGEQTALFTLDGDSVVAGEALQTLLDCLKAGDYLGVNAIFCRVPAYAQILEEVADGALFPSSKIRLIEPGLGVLLDGKLVSSLVRRPENSQ